jgi:hypothetical protein
MRLQFHPNSMQHQWHLAGAVAQIVPRRLQMLLGLLFHGFGNGIAGLGRSSCKCVVGWSGL